MTTPYTLEYVCYKYKNYDFFLIKIPTHLLKNFSYPVSYHPEKNDFTFNIKQDLLISQENNKIIITNFTKDSLVISDISQNIIKDWINKKTFYFKFVRENINLNLPLNHPILNDSHNVIGMLKI